MHMFNHALAKGALFLAVAGLATRFSDLRLAQLGGAASRMPWTCAALVVAGFSLVGVPATAGFISKWLLVVAALEQGATGIGLVALILVSSLMALVYIWQIIETLYFKPVVQGDMARGEAPPQLLAIIWLVALANIYFGFFPQAPLALAELSAAALLGGGA